MTHAEILTAFFDAINRNDIAALAQYMDPDIVRMEPTGFETAGTHRGIPALLAHVAKGRGTWAEGSCDPEQFHAKGDKVVVYLHARVRLKEGDKQIDGRFADGFVFRYGQILEYHTFWQRSEALAWAGIEPG